MGLGSGLTPLYFCTFIFADCMQPTWSKPDGRIIMGGAHEPAHHSTCKLKKMADCMHLLWSGTNGKS